MRAKSRNLATCLLSEIGHTAIAISTANNGRDNRFAIAVHVAGFTPPAFIQKTPMPLFASGLDNGHFYRAATSSLLNGI